MSKEGINKLKQYADTLLSPWVVLSAVFIGAYLGIYQKELVPIIAPVGGWYLSLLQMCILPILLSAIAGSLGRLMRSEVSNRYLKKMLLVFICAMFGTSLLGTAVGLIGGPGRSLNTENRATLGTIIQESSNQPDLVINFSEPFEQSDSVSPLRKFFNDLIPSNIFKALSFDDKLKVLFFSIITGLAIGFIKKKEAEVFFSMLEAIYQAFAKVVCWLMYLLPFGLCGLIADQLSKVGPGILLAMTKFVLIVFVSFLLLFILCAIAIKIRTRKTVLGVMLSLKEPFIISLATGNSLAAIPSMLSHMHTELGFEKRIIDLVCPLGVTVCRFGPIFYFGFTSLFVVQLYQVDFSLQQFVIVIIGSTFAGMATAGATGILSLTMLALVLESLGLPLEAVLVLLIVVDPITAPLRSVTNILVTAAATAWVTAPQRDINLYIGKNDRREIWNGEEQRQRQEAMVT